VRDSLVDLFPAALLLGVIIGGTVFGLLGRDFGRDNAVSAIAADLAAQGYVLQHVETVGEGARWMVAEQ
jgi:hypothetical protein